MSLISLDSIIEFNKKYYPQTLLQECVYKFVNKKVENIITNINFDSSSESDNELDVKCQILIPCLKEYYYQYQI